jgi:hypothetical protein
LLRIRGLTIRNDPGDLFILDTNVGMTVKMSGTKQSAAG